tara:strand:- start:234 stop:1097 length:864 start_codon:yes stop_codon:yes gene_type:complete
MKTKKLFNRLRISKRKEITKSYYKRKNPLKTLKNKDFIDLSSGKYSKLLRASIIKNIKNKKLTKKNVFILEKIEKSLKEKYKKFDKSNTNKISEKLYTLDNEFHQNYVQFLKFLKKKYFKFSFYYQKTPNVRVGISSKGKYPTIPDLHTDFFLGHPFDIINIWLPLTKPDKKEKHNFNICNFKSSNQVMKTFGYDIKKVKGIISTKKDQMITKYLLKNSTSIKTKFGKFMIFDSRCIHTSMKTFNHNRVSLDIRIYPKEIYDNCKYIFKGSGRKKMLYTFKNSYGLI